jgi:hypothetical protein
MKDNDRRRQRFYVDTNDSFQNHVYSLKNLPFFVFFLYINIFILISCKQSVRALIFTENQPEAMQTGSCGKSQSYYVVISLIILIAACNFIREEIHLSSTRQWPSKAVATANNNKEEERKNKRSKKKASTKLSQTSNNIKQQNNNTKKNILSFLINHKLHDEKKQSPQQHQVKGVFIATTAMSQETSFIRNVVVVKS